MATKDSNRETHTPPTSADQRRVQELISGGMSAAAAIAQATREAVAGWVKLGGK